MTEIKGKVALVTGGRRGIGKALVDGLLERGASKVYSTARTVFSADDPRIEPLALEVTDPGSVEALAVQTSNVQIVINNAGVLHAEPLLTGDWERIVETFDTNLSGPLLVARALAPTLKANGGGALVNMQSILSWLGGAGAYGASKAGLWSLSNSLRVELKSQNTQVLGVHPAYVDTEMISKLDVPKSSPDVVAQLVLDALEAGEDEVLIGEVTHQVKSMLSGPVGALTVTR